MTAGLVCEAATVTVDIPYVRDLDAVPGRVDQLSPLIRRVLAPNPGKFTYRGTGTYLVGRGDVAVIDPGPLLDEHVAAIVAALAPGERITHLVMTHTHSDHSPAAARLQPLTNAPSYGFGPHGALPADDPDDVIEFGDPEADGDPARDTPADEGKLRESADTSFVPDVVVGAGDVIEGHGWRLEALHTPGHTSNHVCYALAQEAVLFTGDHVMGWSTSVIGPPDGNLRQYLRSLEMLLGRSDRRYWPTHGPAVDDPHRLVRAYIAHRQERTDQVLEVLRQGPATIAQMVPVVYAAVDKQLWKPAAASMYAHILLLVEDGRIAPVEGPAKRSALYRRLG
ncbi:MAG: beta-lactamase domain protein [Acidimicrobiia bacterium]|nr:beta-lactamase domain protein [Acidimicrobiia bacterium]